MIECYCGLTHKSIWVVILYYSAYYEAVTSIILLQLLQCWGQTLISATVDTCIHVPVGSICVCLDGKESIWRSMQAAVLSALQTMLSLCSNAPTGLAQGDQRLMRQPSHKRTQQTHEYWYDSGERWRQGVSTCTTVAQWIKGGGGRGVKL